jgi:hypothetical protein
MTEQAAEIHATLNDLIERLEGARDSLTGLAQRPTNTTVERDRLTSKREGVELALTYAREAERTLARATCTCGWGGVHDPDNPRCDKNASQNTSPAEPELSEGPHSRACGIRRHNHGSDCHANCPTCGGRHRAISAEQADAPAS